MADSSDLGCAIRSDGTLKDASEIEWHFDKDDDLLIAPTSATLSATHIPVDIPVHPFFSGQPLKSVMIAGSCCSCRTLQPSACILDPDNAMNQHATSSTPAARAFKQKAPASMPLCRVLPRVDSDSCGEDEGETDATSPSAHPPCDASEVEDCNEMTDEYDALQVIADADHQVRCMASFNRKI
jgi:hypothetical protein